MFNIFKKDQAQEQSSKGDLLRLDKINSKTIILLDPNTPIINEVIKRVYNKLFEIDNLDNKISQSQAHKILQDCVNHLNNTISVFDNGVKNAIHENSKNKESIIKMIDIKEATKTDNDGGWIKYDIEKTNYADIPNLIDIVTIYDDVEYELHKNDVDFTGVKFYREFKI